MGDRQGIYFEMSTTLTEKLEKRIDELDSTKREYFENFVREDTEHITLDDPAAELAEVEEQLQTAHGKLEELRDEETDVRESIRELEQEKEQLEDRTEKSGLVTAASYDDAIDALIDRAVKSGIAETGTDVERVAEEWGRDARIVCRDVFENSIRVRPEDVSVKGRIPIREVPNGWEKEWPEYDKAVKTFAERVLTEGVIYDGQNTVSILPDVYERDNDDVAKALVEEANPEVVAVVDRDFGESLSPSAAPEADLVVGEHIAERIGLNEESKQDD